MTLTFITWPKSCLTGLFGIKVLPPTPILYSLEEVTKSSQSRADGWGREVSIWDSSVRNICPFASIYVFIRHLFLSTWTRVGLFYTLSSNTGLHYLFFRSNHYSFGHWKHLQVGSCVPLTGPHPSLCYLSTFSLFPLVSSCIFPDSVLEWAISSRNPGPFIGELHLEAKMWALDVFNATGMSLLLGPPSRRR